MTSTINGELAVQLRDGVTVEKITWGGSRCYPVDERVKEKAVLSVRSVPDDVRNVVPRKAWQFAVNTPGSVPRFGPVHVYVPAGFEKGKLYELIYTGRILVSSGLVLHQRVMRFRLFILKPMMSSATKTHWQ